MPLRQHENLWHVILKPSLPTPIIFLAIEDIGNSGDYDREKLFFVALNDVGKFGPNKVQHWLAHQAAMIYIGMHLVGCLVPGLPDINAVSFPLKR